MHNLNDEIPVLYEVVDPTDPHASGAGLSQEQIQNVADRLALELSEQLARQSRAALQEVLDHALDQTMEALDAALEEAIRRRVPEILNEGR
ncbi:MAG: hypothetical protein KDH88_03175 [Chromatiales bacterium]|nr:hypothetical protein [Chromatiales bacterium]